MTETTYRIAVNRNHKGKHPAGMDEEAKLKWFKWYNGGFCNEELTVDQLAAAIREGYAITAWHRDNRAVANFICAQHIGLDFDGGEMSLDQVANLPAVLKYAALIYTTVRHTPEHPRLRVVFLLDKPIHDPDKLELLAKSLLHYFGTADPACSDPARMFYGSPGCEIVPIGRVLHLNDAATAFVEPYKAFTASPTPSPRPAAPVQSRNDVPAEVLQRRADQLLAHVLRAPNGEKYYTLRDISRTLGGYVGGGYYTRDQVTAWLKAAIETRRGDVGDMSHAYRTIEEWVDRGMGEPLYFEERTPAGPQGLTRSTAWQAAALAAVES